MACDEDVIPAPERVADVSDEMELDEVYATERQLLYAAATRARDRLLISGVSPGSEFLICGRPTDVRDASRSTLRTKREFELRCSRRASEIRNLATSHDRKISAFSMR
jgi:superfamily I DNA/RNA helicase